MKLAPAVGFRYRTSRMLILATLMTGVLAMAAVWLSALPRWTGLALILVTMAYAGVALRNLLRPRVRSVVWRADGGIDIALNDRPGDDRREAHGVIHAARVMGPLIALTLRWPPRGRATLWLLPDSLDADTRRRLRMRLGADPDGSFASGNADSG
ncbi:MAG TPA: protein YgfX [Rhodanobacteraceae bacterium]|nr:protein YgfX [Rhodanobacteraceae bacterium]